jgi:hypothetical protein
VLGFEKLSGGANVGAYLRAAHEFMVVMYEQGKIGRSALIVERPDGKAKEGD